MKDGLTGQGPEPEDEQLQSLRGTLFALTALKTLESPVTEADLAADYGRQILAFRQELNNFWPFNPALSREERDLASDFIHSVENGHDLDRVVYYEQQRRIERYRLEARRYMDRLVRQRQEEDAKPENQRNTAKLVDISSRLFIAGYLRARLDRHEHDGERNPLEGFNPVSIQSLSDKMTRAETGQYYRAILAEVISREAPGRDEASLTEYIGRVGHACDRLNLLDQQPDQHVLSDYDDKSLRLAVFRQVKRALDGTGSGYTWFFRSSRDGNSDELNQERVPSPGV
ncbi:MAG: hypothetical protein IKI02_03110 [Oscillospiraceae bacterium]|nr:hypothetical protein [Oscillospiraceae bacterium]